MLVTLIWLIAFAVVLFIALKSWDGGLGEFFARNAPAAFKGGRDDRWIWCPALAVLVATCIVNPISMLFTVLLLALIVWLGTKLVRWAMSRAKMH